MLSAWKPDWDLYPCAAARSAHALMKAPGQPMGVEFALLHLAPKTPNGEQKVCWRTRLPARMEGRVTPPPRGRARLIRRRIDAIHKARRPLIRLMISTITAITSKI